MKKPKFTGEEIAFGCVRPRAVAPVAEMRWKLGVSEAMYCRRKQFARRLGAFGAAQDAALEKEH